MLLRGLVGETNDRIADRVRAIAVAAALLQLNDGARCLDGGSLEVGGAIVTRGAERKEGKGRYKCPLPIRKNEG
jgi:hypothetical protein